MRKTWKMLLMVVFLFLFVFFLSFRGPGTNALKYHGKRPVHIPQRNYPDGEAFVFTYRPAFLKSKLLAVKDHMIGSSTWVKSAHGGWLPASIIPVEYDGLNGERIILLPVDGNIWKYCRTNEVEIRLQIPFLEKFYLKQKRIFQEEIGPD